MIVTFSNDSCCVFCKGMKMNKSKLFLMMTFFSSFLVADDQFLNHKTLFNQVMNFVGESDFIHSCSKNIQTKIDEITTAQMFDLGDEPASEKYQELGRQAQFKVGIPEDRHLPIKKLNPTSPLGELAGAIAEADAIYVNEDKFDKRAFGAVHCMLCHESIHVKYNDKVVDQIIEIIVLIGASVGTFLILKTFDVRVLRKTLSLVVGFSLSSYVTSQYHHFMECRADTEGHYATQCSSCVREHGARRAVLFEKEDCPLKYNGYLWAQDLEKIAQGLGDKKCAHHRE